MLNFAAENNNILELEFYPANWILDQPGFHLFFQEPCDVLTIEPD